MSLWAILCNVAKVELVKKRRLIYKKWWFSFFLCPHPYSSIHPYIHSSLKLYRMVYLNYAWLRKGVEGKDWWLCFRGLFATFRQLQSLPLLLTLKFTWQNTHPIILRTHINTHIHHTHTLINMMWGINIYRKGGKIVIYSYTWCVSHPLHNV